MTKKFLFPVVSCLFAAVVFSGCGIVGTGKAVVDDKINQFEKYLNDNTVLPRANAQLAEAKQSRSTLNELAKQRRVDVEVSKRQVQRLEEEAAKSETAFTTVQEAAKAGGLPKLSEATEADKEKQFQIAGRGYTGSAVYDLLKTYKDEARKVNDTINRERTKQSFLAGQADNIEKQLSAIDNHIDDLERQIEDYKMYQELLTANQTIANLNIPSGQIERILNTDSMVGELQRLNDTAAVNITQIDSAGDAERLRTEITTATSFSITDDDLL